MNLIYDSKKGGLTEKGVVKYPLYCGYTLDHVAIALIRVIQDPSKIQTSYTEILQMIIDSNRFCDNRKNGD